MTSRMTKRKNDNCGHETKQKQLIMLNTYIENISFIIGKEFWEIRMILDKKYYRTYDGHRDKQQKQM